MTVKGVELNADLVRANNKLMAESGSRLSALTENMSRVLSLRIDEQYPKNNTPGKEQSGENSGSPKILDVSNIVEV